MIRTLMSIFVGILIVFASQAGAIEYPSAGVSRRVLHVLKHGHWASMAETYGFVFKHRDREVSDQYGLVTFKEARIVGKDSHYLVLLLDGSCARNMQEFYSIPKECVQEEKWMSGLGIELLIRQGLLESEYKDLYPHIKKYLGGK